MPIEFTCPSCSTSIRTPDGSAGKKGKCPKCAAIVQIPAASPAPASQTAAAKFTVKCPSCSHALQVPASLAGKRGKCPRCESVIPIPNPYAQPTQPVQPASDDLTPLGDGLTSSDDLFGDLSSDPLAFPASPLAAPLGGAVVHNPYATPTAAASPAYGASGQNAAKGKVMAPAIALIVSSGLSVVVFVVYGIVQLAIGAATPPPGMDEAGAAGYRFGFVCGIFLPVVINGIGLAGSIAMLRMQSYASAMTAAILAIVPCSALCLIGSMPIGIWALVVLLSDDVKRAFK